MAMVYISAIFEPELTSVHASRVAYHLVTTGDFHETDARLDFAALFQRM